MQRRKSGQHQTVQKGEVEFVEWEFHPILVRECLRENPYCCCPRSGQVSRKRSASKRWNSSLSVKLSIACSCKIICLISIDGNCTMASSSRALAFVLVIPRSFCFSYTTNRRKRAFILYMKLESPYCFLRKSYHVLVIGSCCGFSYSKSGSCSWDVFWAAGAKSAKGVTFTLMALHRNSTVGS